jgi:6-phosphogluconolactonase
MDGAGVPEAAVQHYEDREALDEALAVSIAGDLDAAIAARGRASLALSGGSTPRGLLTQLGKADIPWEHVSVTLVDERWVPASHADSNARMVRETLLAGAAGRARFLPMYLDRAHPSAAVDDIEAVLAPLGTIDVLMLGMGGDGHFASLFPGSAALRPGLDLNGAHRCIAVDPPAAPHPRMSMTLARIVDTRRLILHITGQDKLDVLGRAARERDADTLPIAAVLGLAKPTLEIHWAP